jgi:hypothetical protein
MMAMGGEDDPDSPKAEVVKVGRAYKLSTGTLLPGDIDPVFINELAIQTGK